jgi:carbamoyl-phosphate synthase large subunit
LPVCTGNSITVAPGQTLTDREYHTMRGAAIAVMREIGVETVPLGPDESTLLRVRLPLRPARQSFPENVQQSISTPTPGGHDE